MTYYQYRMCGKGRLESWVWSHEHDLFVAGVAMVIAWILLW